jgi:hypothetical protein
MHYRSSLAGSLLTAVVVVVGCIVALRWAYDLLLPMLWLVPVICVLVAAVFIWRRWWGRSL